MSTNQLSHQKMQRSRNMQSDILHAVAEVKQVNVAKCLDVDSSTVGRWLDSSKPDSQLVRFCDMLAFCNLKVVPANAQCYDKEKIDILFHITKYHFQNLEAVDDFFQNDAGMTDSRELRFSRGADLPCTSAATTAFGWVASLYTAIKAFIVAKNEAIRPSILVARQSANAEIEEERQALTADEQRFWKLFYVFIHIVLVLIVLVTIYRFWG